MGREHEYYRDCLADICEFTGKRLLTAADVGRYLGIDLRTVQRRFNVGPEGIPAPTLARKLARICD